MTTVARDQPARWRLRHLIAFLIILAAVIGLRAMVAFATNVDVTQSAACVNGDTGRYDVTVGLHNDYTTVLHVRVNNPASPIDLTLAPDQRWSYTFHVTDGPWKVTFTTTDAHLQGDTSHTWTLTDVCGVTVTTTTPPVTTCRQANPPRDDCNLPPGTVAPIPSTLPDIPVPSTVAPEPTTSPSASTPVTSAAPVPEPSSGAGAAHPIAQTPTTRAITLPVTGGGSDAWFTAGLGLCLATAGLMLVVLTRRRSS